MHMQTKKKGEVLLASSHPCQATFWQARCGTGPKRLLSGPPCWAALPYSPVHWWLPQPLPANMQPPRPTPRSCAEGGRNPPTGRPQHPEYAASALVRCAVPSTLSWLCLEPLNGVGGISAHLLGPQKLSMLSPLQPIAWSAKCRQRSVNCRDPHPAKVSCHANVDETCMSLATDAGSQQGAQAAVSHPWRSASQSCSALPLPSPPQPGWWCLVSHPRQISQQQPALGHHALLGHHHRPLHLPHHPQQIASAQFRCCRPC
mmetsp:Transcript_60063/g.143067  ORF Transcript_60063/g.143067 Transcript_60063/m.143067 type:complete len:259 (-) Transcript_60063:231-1007(-)